jgi:hypothetical protein
MATPRPVTVVNAPGPEDRKPHSLFGSDHQEVGLEARGVTVAQLDRHTTAPVQVGGRVESANQCGPQSDGGGKRDRQPPQVVLEMPGDPELEPIG